MVLKFFGKFIKVIRTWRISINFIKINQICSKIMISFKCLISFLLMHKLLKISQSLLPHWSLINVHSNCNQSYFILNHRNNLILEQNLTKWDLIMFNQRFLFFQNILLIINFSKRSNPSSLVFIIFFIHFLYVKFCKLNNLTD